MSEMTFDQRADEAVKKFNLTDEVLGRAVQPSDTVTVYLDAQAAYDLQKKKTENDASVKRGEPQSIGVDEDLEALIAKVRESALRFTLRALYEPERDVIANKVQRERHMPKNATDIEKNLRQLEVEDRIMAEWLARSITKVERLSDGAVDDSGYTADQVEELRATLYDSEWKKLTALLSELSLTQTLFTSAVDAGFPG